MTENEDCILQGINNDNHNNVHKENVIKISLFLLSVYYLIGHLDGLWIIFTNCVTSNEIILHNVVGGVLLCSWINSSSRL